MKRLCGRRRRAMMRCMSPSAAAFQRSIDHQIRINQARTPGERLDALCELMDIARAMAPTGVEAEHRRRSIRVAREKEKERWREQCRRHIAAQRAGSQDGAEAIGRRP